MNRETPYAASVKTSTVPFNGYGITLNALIEVGINKEDKNIADSFSCS